MCYNSLGRAAFQGVKPDKKDAAKLDSLTPRHDFHKVVDLHQLFMVPYEGIIHPNVEHHILSPFFFGDSPVPLWDLTVQWWKPKNHWEIAILCHTVILSAAPSCQIWRGAHHRQGVTQNCPTNPTTANESLHRPWIGTRSPQIALLLLWPSDQRDLLPKAMPQKWICRSLGNSVKKHLDRKRSEIMWFSWEKAWVLSSKRGHVCCDTLIIPTLPRSRVDDGWPEEFGHQWIFMARVTRVALSLMFSKGAWILTLWWC